MSNRRFSSAIGAKVEKQYSDVVKPMHGSSSRGGCMTAVYNGAITALYGESFAKNLWKAVYRKSRKLEKAKKKPEGTYNSVDLIMEMLQGHGLAGDPWKFRYKNKKLQCESPNEYVGKGVEEAITESLRNSQAGWYFFGASVSGGYHSVVLGVRQQGNGQKIYWLDQYSKGLQRRRGNYATARTEVTGKLDQTLMKVGTNRTKLWQLFVAVALQDMAKGLSWSSQKRIDMHEPTVVASQGLSGLMTKRVGHRGGHGLGRGPLKISAV